MGRNEDSTCVFRQELQLQHALTTSRLTCTATVVLADTSSQETGTPLHQEGSDILAALVCLSPTQSFTHGVWYQVGDHLMCSSDLKTDHIQQRLQQYQIKLSVLIPYS